MACDVDGLVACQLPADDGGPSRDDQADHGEVPGISQMDGGHVVPAKHVPQEGPEEEAGILIGKGPAAAEKIGKARSVFILIIIPGGAVPAILQGPGDSRLIPQDLFRQIRGDLTGRGAVVRHDPVAEGPLPELFVISGALPEGVQLPVEPEIDCELRQVPPGMPTPFPYDHVLQSGGDMVPDRMPSGEEAQEPEGCCGGLKAALQWIRVGGQDGELMELFPEPLQGYGPCLQEEEGLHGLYVF